MSPCDNAVARLLTLSTKSSEATMNNTESKKPQGRGVKTVQAVERALRILEAMGELGRPQNLTELSEHLNMNPSTLYRLLLTLCRSGFVVYDRGQYRLSFNAYRIGQAALEAIDFRREGRPIMMELVSRCGETANLVMLHGRDAIFVEQVESSRVLRSIVPVGSRIPAHTSGGGKALLAELPESAAVRLFQGYAFETYTKKSVASLEELTRELAAIRRRGYAVDDEEYEIGVRCVGAVIRDHLGKAVAALTITGPTARMPDPFIHSELAPLVVDYAKRISARLGLQDLASPFP